LYFCFGSTHAFFSNCLQWPWRENFRIDLFTILIDERELDFEFRYNAYKNTCDSFGVSGKLHDGNDEGLTAGGKKLIEVYN